ncbi:hypothetical protein Dda_4919 [Drechslerella dactyloides]|uniref:Calcineurin-like phosphoesterase domain-containing protein n=1 Tax=Drechslerella dactyloides TaxID=74499 RepID=A0AAD6IXT1_DREDA|nr:hypothetical protein Dda_4919 [Drechslerella dactyloides]
MKYEKLPLEDFDSDAHELSVELTSNVDSDEEVLSLDDTPIFTDPESDASGPARSKKDALTPREVPLLHQRSGKQRSGKKRSPWVRHMRVLVMLLLTTIAVFTFLPSAITKLVTWRHTKLYGGSCKGMAGQRAEPAPENSDEIDVLSATDAKANKKDTNNMNLYTAPSTSFNPYNSYIQLSTLPEKYIPKPQGPGKSLVFIGDVHGMLSEFQELLEKLESKGFLEDSHLVLTGDMISKGPDSLKLVDTLIALNASCVRGNHEDEVMKAYWKLRSKSIETDDGDYLVVESDPERKPYEKADEHNDTDMSERRKKKHRKNKDKKKNKKKNGDKLKTKKPKDKKSKGKKSKKHQNKFKYSDVLLAKSLHRRHAEYLESCPLILKLDGVSNLGDVAVVHAGMAAGVELQRQKPSVVMNVRTFVKKVPTPGRKGVHWSRLWNDYQFDTVKRAAGKALTVVYGHDARRGLELRKYTKGLDTNCVRGGRLTALVVKGGKKGGTHVVSVPCRKYL